MALEKAPSSTATSVPNNTATKGTTVNVPRLGVLVSEQHFADGGMTKTRSTV